MSGSMFLGGRVYRHGSKPMVPCWDRCTMHFRTYFNGDWDVQWVQAFDPLTCELNWQLSRLRGFGSKLKPPEGTNPLVVHGMIIALGWGAGEGGCKNPSFATIPNTKSWKDGRQEEGTMSAPWTDLNAGGLV